MNMTPLILDVDEDAQADIAEIGCYYAERDRDVENRFYLAVEQTIQTLTRSPYLGERCRFRNSTLEGMRVWQVFGFSNYLIFYRPQGDTLHVLRIFHGARDYNTMFNEE